MAERRQFPEFRDQFEPTRYPFASTSTLTNGSQTILEGTFLDASLYPIGGGERLYLSQVRTTHDTVTLVIGDLVNEELASGSFDLIDPPDVVPFVDAYGRPAGVLVSESTRLAVFQGWGVGTYSFDFNSTEFVASCCIPTPQQGVRGLELEDGSILTGDVWLVGGDGVVLSKETLTVPSSDICGSAMSIEVVRIDIVGDPLFRRRLCQPSNLFTTPRFVTTVTFTDGLQSMVVSPDAFGDIKLTVNNALASDTVLRVRPAAEGVIIEAVGSSLQANQ